MQAVTGLDELYRDYLATCNDHDLPRLGERVADAVLVNGVEQTRDEFVREFERVCDAFPDHLWEVERQVVADPWVTVVLRTTGKQVGGWRGLAPTGRQVEGREIDLVRFDDGLLVEVWSVPDDISRFFALSADL